MNTECQRNRDKNVYNETIAKGCAKSIYISTRNSWDEFKTYAVTNLNGGKMRQIPSPPIILRKNSSNPSLFLE